MQIVSDKCELSPYTETYFHTKIFGEWELLVYLVVLIGATYLTYEYLLSYQFVLQLVYDFIKSHSPYFIIELSLISLISLLIGSISGAILVVLSYFVMEVFPLNKF